VKYFFDNTFPKRLARAIDKLSDFDVTHKTAMFAPDTADVDWITALARTLPWAVVTLDNRMQRNPLEREALQQAKLTVFFCKKGWKDQRFWVQAQYMVKWWPTFEGLAKTNALGTWFSVPLIGRVQPIAR
jgi:hypothetical protein